MEKYSSPRWSNELLDCSMPMSFDTYSKCSFNCLYCFSYYQKSHENSPTLVKKGLTQRDYQKKEIKAVDVDYIKSIFSLKKECQFTPLIKEKVTMQWGGLADQFDFYEKQHGVTLELLKFFDEIDYPLSFSTKSTWFVRDERYMSLIRKHPNWHFKISIINLDPEISKVIEKGVASPQERLEAIKLLSKTNPTTLRLRPFIMGMSDKNGEHLELIKLAKEAGAQSVSTEFFCLEQRADIRLKKRYQEMSKAIGFDIQKFYKVNSSGTGYLRLNYNIKKKIMNEMKAKCDEVGLRFYVSDAHHKHLCHHGSCCGMPESFNYCKGQYTEALKIAEKTGQVCFTDIEPYIQHFKKILWKSASGLNTKSNLARIQNRELTLYEFIRRKWNNPKDLNSPYIYLNGVLKPIGLDKENNVIYKYNIGEDKND